jgi:enoyl-CoA hydratase/carnithine racemase
MSENAILLQIVDSIATITLNAPARHNALTNDDLALLEDILQQLEGNELVRVLIITGRGEKTFCAGASLEQIEESLTDGHRYQRTVDRVQSFSRPTICALNGNVYGGGVELALACDFRIGIEGTRLFVPPVKLGICYPYRGLQRFVSRLGLAATKRLLLANETFEANGDNDIGFYDYIVPRTELDARTQDIATRLAGFAPLAVQGMKSTLNEIAAGVTDLDAAQRREQACILSEDFKEGLAAINDRRLPVFKGR